MQSPIEIYNAKNKNSPEFLCDIFQFTDKASNLRYKSTLRRRQDKAANFGNESISLLVPKIGEVVRKSIKRVLIDFRTINIYTSSKSAIKHI